MVDHPQEDLAKFGYRSEKKVEKLRTLVYSNNIQPIVHVYCNFLNKFHKFVFATLALIF
jgi:hypothetical protein